MSFFDQEGARAQQVAKADIRSFFAPKKKKAPPSGDDLDDAALIRATGGGRARRGGAKTEALRPAHAPSRRRRRRPRRSGGPPRLGLRRGPAGSLPLVGRREGRSALALLGLHVRERGDAHDVRDLRDAAGAGELVVDGGGAATVLRLVHILITVDDALRVQRLGEHGPRVGLFIAGRRSIHAAHGRL